MSRSWMATVKSLPGYVDDVIEGYYDPNTDRFYEDAGHTTVITPAADKLWVDVSTNKSYRWTGSVYVRVDEGVQLGETSGTAYRGDRGKTAYDHSQLVTGNPHGVTASDVGLGSVANTGDSDTPVSGGTTKFTTGGAFAELAKKADKVTGGSTGDFAGLDANGNLTDSGSKAADFAAAVHTHTKSQITDFPTLGTAAALDVPVSGNASSSQVVKGNDTRLSVMTGASASTAGTAGIVPAPSAGDESKVLSGAGVWVPQSSGGSGKADITSIGSDESGRTTASRAYAQGEHFYKDGKFCEAKTAIASGATLTLNTNYTESTISDVITTLNSQLVDIIPTLLSCSTNNKTFGDSIIKYKEITISSLPNNTEYIIQLGSVGLVALMPWSYCEFKLLNNAINSVWDITTMRFEGTGGVSLTISRDDAQGTKTGMAYQYYLILKQIISSNSLKAKFKLWYLVRGDGM